MLRVMVSCKRDVLAFVRLYYQPSLTINVACSVNPLVLVTIGMLHCCRDCCNYWETLLHRTGVYNLLSVLLMSVAAQNTVCLPSMVVPASKHVSQHQHVVSISMRGLSGRYLLMHGTGIHTTAAKATKVRSMLQLPGADAGKPDVKGAAEKAVKKSPLGFMNVGELAFDLPGSNVSKDDLPNNVKPGDAAGLPKGPTAKPPSLPSLPKVHTCYQSILRCTWKDATG